jgi:uroporphyrin-III C-methyltransferase
MKGKVILVGAGPGDPDLITVKGLKALRSADVVVYDRLVSTDLLKECKPTCEKIYAGKGYGEAELQGFINEVLVRKAMEGKIVVRLKGGDPYVFGRGEEECLYVLENGIECEVIPGVSSVTAGPLLAGIPLAGRTTEPLFAAITATRAGGELIEPEYIPERGNLVFVMGASRVAELARVIMRRRSPSEPVAIIKDASLPTMEVTITTLEEVSTLSSLRPPSLIVVGKSVKLRDKLWKFR